MALGRKIYLHKSVSFELRVDVSAILVFECEDARKRKKKSINKIKGVRTTRKGIVQFIATKRQQCNRS